jgi:hypothetical protein
MQYYMPGKYSKSTRAGTPGTKYPVDLVWAAAVAAHRINDNRYIKVTEWDTQAEPPVIKYRTNREVFTELLANPDRLDAGDYQAGQECQDWVRGDVTFKAIKGQLTDFDLSVQKVLGVTENFDSNIDKLALAVVPCLPASQARGLARAETDLRLRQTVNEHVGTVGSKVNLEVEVLRANYSQNYGTWFVTAIDDQNRSVFFSYRAPLSTGSKIKIRGTVKAHRDNATTQLNRVSVLIKETA